MLRAFFTPLGKTCRLILPMISAKGGAKISRQEVTRQSKLFIKNKLMDLQALFYAQKKDISGKIKLRTSACQFFGENLA